MEVSKDKKINLKLNVVDYGWQYGIHLYTSVCCKGDSHIQFLSSFAAYSAIYITFPSMGPCGHFHGCFYMQLSQAQCTVGLLTSFFLMKIQ